MPRPDLPECERCGCRSSKCREVPSVQVRDKGATERRAFVACEPCANYLERNDAAANDRS